MSLDRPDDAAFNPRNYIEGTTEQPHKDRKYVLTAAQAEALRDALDAVLRKLETQQERSVKEPAPN